MSQWNDFRDVKPTDDYLVGDVVALREFRLYEGNSSIGGLSYNQSVLPGKNVAQCAIHRDDEKHVAPVEDCQCGWYAYDEPRKWGSRQTPSTSPVAGQFSAIVHLSGRLVLCERGIKAQHMEVKAVVVHPADRSAVLAILPGAEVFDHEDEMLAAHPLVRLNRGPLAALRTKADGGMDRLDRFLTVDRMLSILVCFGCACGFLAMARWGFPAGSVSGYGPLIAPLLMLAAGAGARFLTDLPFYFSYLTLWAYGICSSWGPLMGLEDKIGLTPVMVAVIISVLVLSPTLAVAQERIQIRRARKKPTTTWPGFGTSSLTAVSGAGPAAGRAYAIPSMSAHTLVLGGKGRGTINLSHRSLPPKTL